jgi:hypothetical protein
MNRHHIVAGIALTSLLTLAGCSDPEPPTAPTATALNAPTAVPPSWTPENVPTGKPGTPAGGIPDPAAVDDADPDAVAVAALTGMFSMDTAIDLSPSDADRRAIPWLSEAFADGVRAGSPDGGGADWITLADHQGYTLVDQVLDVSEDGAPADSDQAAYRIYQVTYTPTGRDGWTGEQVTSSYYLTLTRADSTQPWRVDSLTAA